jgi:hypothetical protein
MSTPSVPTTDTAGHVKGRGTLAPPTGQFRGIQGGVPYGEQLENERADVARRWKFSPGVASRLRGATLKALRRG